MKIGVERLRQNVYKLKFDESESKTRTIQINFCSYHVSITYGSLTKELDFDDHFQFTVLCTDGGPKYREERLKVKRAVMKSIVSDIVSTICFLHKRNLDNIILYEKFDFWYKNELTQAFTKEIKKLVKDYVIYERHVFNEKRYLQYLKYLAINDEVYDDSYVQHEFGETHGNLKYFVVPNTGNIWAESVHQFFLVKADACLPYSEVISRVNKELGSEKYAHVRDYNKNAHTMHIPRLNEIPEV